MNFSRTTIAIGLAALSLGVAASPAAAKGGGDTNNTVVTIAPDLIPTPAPAANGNGGKGGSGHPATCTAVGVDPVTGSILMSCTQARA